MLNHNTDIVKIMIQDIDEAMYKLRTVLNKYGIEASKLSMFDLMTAVEKLKVMKTNEKYVGIKKDSNGFVIKAIPIDDFVSLDSIPADVSYGYYKLIDGQFELDEERQRQLGA